MSTFQLLNGLTFAALLFVVASGFTLIFGLLRIVNLAPGRDYKYEPAAAVAIDLCQCRHTDIRSMQHPELWRIADPAALVRLYRRVVSVA